MDPHYSAAGDRQKERTSVVVSVFLPLPVPNRPVATVVNLMADVRGGHINGAPSITPGCLRLDCICLMGWGRELYLQVNLTETSA